jgi:hypothetical protein
MNRLNRFLAILLMLCLTSGARAFDVVPVDDPQALGFSPSRLERIARWQQSHVDAGAFSGTVAAIVRNGKVAYLRAVGFRDRAKTIPLQPDAIFWIASMTKPVTSVAAMMLVEEGKARSCRPGLSVSSRVQGHDGRRREKRPGDRRDRARARAAEASDDRRGSAAAHRRTDPWRRRQQAD